MSLVPSPELLTVCMKEDNDLKIGWMFKVVLQPIQSEYVYTCGNK